MNRAILTCVCVISAAAWMLSSCIADETGILGEDAEAWNIAGADAIVPTADFVGPQGPAAPGEVGYPCDGCLLYTSPSPRD